MTSVIVESGKYFLSQVSIIYLSTLTGPPQTSQIVSGSTTPESRAADITRTLKTLPGSKESEIAGFLKNASPYSQYFAGSYEGNDSIPNIAPEAGSITIMLPAFAPYFSIPSRSFERMVN